MQLRKNGSSIAGQKWSWAKRPTDGSERWTLDVRMHIASCSKLITGIAMTRLLNRENMSYDTPIIDWLPKYWPKGPNIEKITFRNLMTHLSGFNTGKSDSDYEFMKSHVAAGVTDSDYGYYHYQNMNFGLCRILLSTINGNVTPDTTFIFNDQTWDYVTIQAYKKYVENHLFTPSGVSGPGFDHPADDALAYKFPVNGSGWNSGDLSSVSGGAGWHMSVDDLLDVMGTFRRTGTIMTVTHAQKMLDDGFGIDVRTMTPLGVLYNKNGEWGNASDQQEQSLAYFLPHDMELVVLANSPVGPAPHEFFRDIVTNAYLSNIKMTP
jgi:CubicO group peptidase (beta-lactamase class C family)